MVTTRDRIRSTKIQREAEGYLELGMPRQALGSLARLGSPTDFDGHALYLWGEALRVMERYHEAILPLVQAAETTPENLHVWFALGWCYKRIGQVERAIDSLEKALAVEPAEPLVHYNLACYCSLMGNVARAIQYLAQAFDIDPSYRKLVESESDFDPIRADSAFQALCQRTGPREHRRRKKGSSPSSGECASG